MANSDTFVIKLIPATQTHYTLLLKQFSHNYPLATQTHIESVPSVDYRIIEVLTKTPILYSCRMMELEKWVKMR